MWLWESNDGVDQTELVDGPRWKTISPQAWRMVIGASKSLAGFAPPEWYRFPLYGGWPAELYLDEATARGVAYDTQLIGHCGGLVLGDVRTREAVQVLQRPMLAPLAAQPAPR